MPFTECLVVAILAFAAGSIPLSRLVTPNAIPKNRDKQRFAALAKVMIDIVKGFTVVMVAQSHHLDCAIIATIGVFLGHNFPLFKGVSGGNGLGTALGALIALEPTIGLTALSAWTFGYYVFQQPEVAALISATAVPLVAGFLTLPFSALPLWPIAFFIYWRNREKITMVFVTPDAATAHQDT